MECLDNIIGLSQTECECFNPLPTGYNTSASGVFLDELDGFNLKVAAGADDCAKGGLWERMFKAVELAKQDFQTNLLGCVNQRFRPRAELFSGQLGSEEYKTTLSLSNTYVGMQIFPFQLKGAYIKLKRIGIVINAAVPVTVKVLKSINKNATLVASYTTPVPVNANVLTWLDLGNAPLELPMWSYGGKVEYFVVLEMNGTFQPKDNVVDCGCGGVQRPWLAWLDFKGTKGNSLSTFNGYESTKQLNGVVVDVDIRCKTSEIICSAEQPLDFEDDGKSRDMAYAIRFKAAAKMYSDLLSTDQINRPSMMNREEMAAYVTQWNTEYANWVQWFCQNVNIGTNDCLVCREGQTMFKGAILT